MHAYSAEQFLARAGQRHNARTTLKKRRADFRFELLDMTAQRRLRDAQPFGRAAEMQLFREREKRMQVPKFHGGSSDTLSVSNNAD